MLLLLSPGRASAVAWQAFSSPFTYLLLDFSRTQCGIVTKLGHLLNRNLRGAERVQHLQMTWAAILSSVLASCQLGSQVSGLLLRKQGNQSRWAKAIRIPAFLATGAYSSLKQATFAP